MSTAKQQKLAKEIVNNLRRKKPLNKAKLLDMVGYARNTGEKKAGQIIGQIGVQKELAVLGFDKTSAQEVVRDIMLNKKVKPNDRLKATDQIFKVLGSYETETMNLKFANYSREHLISFILSKLTKKE